MTKTLAGKEDKDEKVRYGPYLIYKDSTIADIRTGKIINKHLRKGRYVVGLRMKPESKCTYFQLHRLMYKLFIDPTVTRYDYIIPIDGDYKNLNLSNWKTCKAGLYHKKNKSAGRKRIVTPEKEVEIIHLRQKGYSIRRIAAECDISTYTVHQVITGTYHKNT